LNNIKPKHYVLQNTVELVRVIDDLQCMLFAFIRTCAKVVISYEKTSESTNDLTSNNGLPGTTMERSTKKGIYIHTTSLNQAC